MLLEIILIGTTVKFLKNLFNPKKQMPKKTTVQPAASRTETVTVDSLTAVRDVVTTFIDSLDEETVFNVEFFSTADGKYQVTCTK